MTLLGKIFTVLILIMSVLFLGFSIVVYATHTNWRTVVSNTEPGKPGLVQQLERQKEQNRQLKEMQADLTTTIALEQAARRFALAALESKLKARSDELMRVQQELAKLIATEGTTAGALVTAQNQLANLTTEVNQLRDDIKTAQQDVDAQYALVVQRSDEVNQLRRLKGDLEQREAPLLLQLSAFKDVADKLGVRVDMHPDGTIRTDVDNIPPKVDGVVVNVGEKDLIEISIGDDDGIKKGHKLDVYRDNAYLGKVIIVKTSPDRAVGEIIPEYKKGIIRKGDRVATKFS
jgi:ribosomal protein S15P/S13E